MCGVGSSCEALLQGGGYGGYDEWGGGYGGYEEDYGGGDAYMGGGHGGGYEEYGGGYDGGYDGYGAAAGAAGGMAMVPMMLPNGQVGCPISFSCFQPAMSTAALHQSLPKMLVTAACTGSLKNTSALYVIHVSTCAPERACQAHCQELLKGMGRIANEAHTQSLRRWGMSCKEAARGRSAAATVGAPPPGGPCARAGAAAATAAAAAVAARAGGVAAAAAALAAGDTSPTEQGLCWRSNPLRVYRLGCSCGWVAVRVDRCMQCGRDAIMCHMKL